MTVRNTAYSGGIGDPHSSDLRQCPTLRRLSEVTLGEKMDSNHYLWQLGEMCEIRTHVLIPESQTGALNHSANISINLSSRILVVHYLDET